MFDIHGISRSKIDNPTHLLLRTTAKIGTTDSHLVFTMNDICLADWAMVWHFPWLCIAMTSFFIDLDHFGDHISTFFNDDPISNANIFTLYLFLIVQSSPRNGTPGKEDRFELCHRGQNPCSPHL